jgi:hypothetical protein
MLSSYKCPINLVKYSNVIYNHTSCENALNLIHLVCSVLHITQFQGPMKWILCHWRMIHSQAAREEGYGTVKDKAWGLGWAWTCHHPPYKNHNFQNIPLSVWKVKSAVRLRTSIKGLLHCDSWREKEEVNATLCTGKILQNKILQMIWSDELAHHSNLHSL